MKMYNDDLNDGASSYHRQHSSNHPTRTSIREDPSRRNEHSAVSSTSSTTVSTSLIMSLKANNLFRTGRNKQKTIHDLLRRRSSSSTMTKKNKKKPRVDHIRASLFLDETLIPSPPSSSSSSSFAVFSSSSPSSSSSTRTRRLAAAAVPSTISTSQHNNVLDAYALSLTTPRRDVVAQEGHDDDNEDTDERNDTQDDLAAFYGRCHDRIGGHHEGKKLVLPTVPRRSPMTNTSSRTATTKKQTAARSA